MAGVTRGLGRGLDALLGGARRQEEGELQSRMASGDVESVPIEDVRPNPHQPRTEFPAEALQELADSIRSQGVLQPVLIRMAADGGYELVAGERRLRAAKMAGLESVPALVKEMSDAESLAIALIENLQREDLNPIEEARGYHRLQQEFGVGQEELARQVGKSRSALANSLRLLQLPDSVQHDIRDGALSAGHGRALASVTDKAAQRELAARIQSQGLTVRQAEHQAAHWREQGELPDHTASVSQATSARTGAKTRSRAKRGADPQLQRITQALSRELQLTVRMSGTLEQGSVTLQYATEEELGLLLDKLGLGFEDI